MAFIRMLELDPGHVTVYKISVSKNWLSSSCSSKQFNQRLPIAKNPPLYWNKVWWKDEELSGLSCYNWATSLENLHFAYIKSKFTDQLHNLGWYLTNLDCEQHLEISSEIWEMKKLQFSRHPSYSRWDFQILLAGHCLVIMAQNIRLDCWSWQTL